MFLIFFSVFYFSKKPGLLIISSLFMEESKHFTFQTKWIAKQLLACKMDNLAYQGGLLSDVTY
jgi:hypothetical protein